jgi:hypothetical protein
MPQF